MINVTEALSEVGLFMDSLSLYIFYTIFHKVGMGIGVNCEVTKSP